MGRYLPEPKPRPNVPRPQIPGPDDTWKLKLRIARQQITNAIRRSQADPTPEAINYRVGLSHAASILSDMLGPEEEEDE